MLVLAIVAAKAGGAPPGYELDDSHFHLTNYIQEGIDIRKLLDINRQRTYRRD